MDGSHASGLRSVATFTQGPTVVTTLLYLWPLLVLKVPCEGGGTAALASTRSSERAGTSAGMCTGTGAGKRTRADAPSEPYTVPTPFLTTRASVEITLAGVPSSFGTTGATAPSVEVVGVLKRPPSVLSQTSGS